ncbi:hypothetical protein BT96DRAFT_110185 [Gymnopus androsaceus JB14]|uniref:Uncharacterized protein n=1 Tax=Gymnopus androsaceus JB14 TaxID=1447944 RepID=A0A6A4GCI3_9AGAR|nr:hypothetical protein BT96DRAFT_110185 [Gymnopus androsaceus JB14]
MHCSLSAETLSLDEKVVAVIRISTHLEHKQNALELAEKLTSTSKLRTVVVIDENIEVETDIDNADDATNANTTTDDATDDDTTADASCIENEDGVVFIETLQTSREKDHNGGNFDSENGGKGGESSDGKDSSSRGEGGGRNGGPSGGGAGGGGEGGNSGSSSGGGAGQGSGSSGGGRNGGNSGSSSGGGGGQDSDSSPGGGPGGHYAIETSRTITSIADWKYVDEQIGQCFTSEIRISAPLDIPVKYRDPYKAKMEMDLGDGERWRLCKGFVQLIVDKYGATKISSTSSHVSTGTMTTGQTISVTGTFVASATPNASVGAQASRSSTKTHPDNSFFTNRLGTQLGRSENAYEIVPNVPDGKLNGKLVLDLEILPKVPNAPQPNEQLPRPVVLDIRSYYIGRPLIALKRDKVVEYILLAQQIKIIDLYRYKTDTAVFTVTVGSDPQSPDQDTQHTNRTNIQHIDREGDLPSEEATAGPSNVIDRPSDSAGSLASSRSTFLSSMRSIFSNKSPQSTSPSPSAMMDPALPAEHTSSPPAVITMPSSPSGIIHSNNEPSLSPTAVASSSLPNVSASLSTDSEPSSSSPESLTHGDVANTSLSPTAVTSSSLPTASAEPSSSSPESPTNGDVVNASFLLGARKLPDSLTKTSGKLHLPWKKQKRFLSPEEYTWILYEYRDGEISQRELLEPSTTVPKYVFNPL